MFCKIRISRYFVIFINDNNVSMIFLFLSVHLNILTLRIVSGVFESEHLSLRTPCTLWPKGEVNARVQRLKAA